MGFLRVKHFRALSSTEHACAQCYLVTTAIYIIGALDVGEILVFSFSEKKRVVGVCTKLKCVIFHAFYLKVPECFSQVIFLSET